MERDYLFFIDPVSLNLGMASNMNRDGITTFCGKKRQTQRLAIALSAFEVLLKDRCEAGIIQILRNFPNVEEIVLLLGDVVSSDGVTRGNLDVVEVKEKEVLKRGFLMALCMEMFQPWRAFDHLWGAEMVECAVERWIEDVVRRNGEFGFDWKPLSVKIRELRPAREFRA
jgi:hypothetical protein